MGGRIQLRGTSALPPHFIVICTSPESVELSGSLSGTKFTLIDVSLNYIEEAHFLFVCALVAVDTTMQGKMDAENAMEMDIASPEKEVCHNRTLLLVIKF